MSDTPSFPPDPNSPSDSAAEAARQKREARKARILSKGSDRLARITNTGRGEGASAYLKDNTPSIPTVRNEEDDPLEVDISTLPPRAGGAVPRGEEATNPFLMFPGAGGGQEGGGGNPMEALMAMMQGAGGGMGGEGQGGQGGPDMSGLPPQLAAMMQQMGGGAGGPGQPPVPTAVQKKSIPERAFDILQAALVVALAVLAAKSSLFDTSHSTPLPDSLTDKVGSISSPSPIAASSTLRRWARLAYTQPDPSEWSLASTSTSLPFLPSTFSTLPLFWIFLSLEITLQAARIALFSKKTPAPPSLLSTFAMMLPIPNLGLMIRLVGKYLALINALVNDVSVLVFVFGASVLWSGYQLGGVGMLEQGAVPGYIHDEL